MKFFITPHTTQMPSNFRFEMQPNKQICLITVLTHFSPVNSSTTTLWTGLFLFSGYFFHHYCVSSKFLYLMQSVDPDQTLHFAASVIGLRCLPVALFGGFPTNMS